MRVQQNLANEPVVPVRVEQRIVCRDLAAIADSFDYQCTQGGFIEAQVQERIVDRAHHSERPESGPLFLDAGQIGGRFVVRCTYLQRRAATVAIE